MILVMGKTKKKRVKKVKPPESGYPVPPHIIGMDWIELPVRSPAASAELYRQIGFSPRGSVGATRLIAIGGTVFVLKRSGVRTAKPANGVLIQMPVDNVDLKREQLKAIGLRPGPLRRQKRGDRFFQWRDPDGHTLRFVGPARRPGEKMLS